MSPQPNAGVIGYPVKHSRSPLIHGHWLERLGLNGSYGKFEVAPGELEKFLTNLAGNEMVGCNVTLPHKEEAFRLVDVADEQASRLQSVNTIWLEGGRLHGSNTDTFGFLANLDERAPGWDSEPGASVVLGAGGASRAIVHGLIERNMTPVHVVNRTLTRAEELARFFGSHVTAHQWTEYPELFAQCRVLVNTTSLGMAGQPPLEIALDRLPPDALVTDIVYTPLITGILQAAVDRGLPIVDGLGMLLHQARPGFRRWFGSMPDVDEPLRRLIVDDLGE